MCVYIHIYISIGGRSVKDHIGLSFIFCITVQFEIDENSKTGMFFFCVGGSWRMNPQGAGIPSALAGKMNIQTGVSRHNEGLP